MRGVDERRKPRFKQFKFQKKVVNYQDKTIVRHLVCFPIISN